LLLDLRDGLLSREVCSCLLFGHSSGTGVMPHVAKSAGLVAPSPLNRFDRGGGAKAWLRELEPFAGRIFGCDASRERLKTHGAEGSGRQAPEEKKLESACAEIRLLLTAGAPQ
jgi:hypothetical protein